jgi:hypothetical protein
MLRLDLSKEPRWHDMGGGVRFLLAPLTTAVLAAARTDPAVEALGPLATRDEQAVALAKAVGRIAILDWQGVGDGEGEPVDPSPEYIDAVLDLWPIFQAFQIGYVSKGLVLAEEGNGSAPSPNGTSAAAPPSAKPARAAATSAQPS